MVYLQEKKVSLLLPAQAAVAGQNINVALGQFNVNIPNFLKEFNDKSIDYSKGMILSLIVEILFDGSFKIKIKGPSILYLIKCILYVLNKNNLVFDEITLSKKDLLLLIFFIRKYRKDLSYISDKALSISLIGSFKCYVSFFYAFK